MGRSLAGGVSTGSYWWPAKVSGTPIHAGREGRAQSGFAQHNVRGHCVCVCVFDRIMAARPNAENGVGMYAEPHSMCTMLGSTVRIDSQDGKR